MFGIGGAELFIILLFAFIVFGPDKMPEMGRTIGRAIRQFREAQEQMNKVVRSEVYDPDSDTDPFSAFFDKSDKKKPEGEKPAASSGTPDAVSGSEPTADESDSEIKMAAPAGETFAQKKARLAAEKRAATADVVRAPRPGLLRMGTLGACTMRPCRRRRRACGPWRTPWDGSPFRR